MLQDFNDFPTSRPSRNTSSCHQSHYKLFQPWNETSSKLPFILINKKLQKSESLLKKKVKILNVGRNNKNSGDSCGIYISKIVQSFSHGKKLKSCKYDSAQFRQKTIKNIKLLQQDPVKQLLRKKLSKRKLKKDPNFPTLPQSRYSSHHDQINSKIEKRLEIERKIFKILSKQRF